ncbi:MAG TPA: CopG family transcriptional regulator [Thermoanaerobaculia bacterium]|nr:CopG family transcriptional regulator [Thermoanaerobaculia bacterium]
MPKKTTIYLTDEQKKAVEQAARSEKRSEANIIRDAISASLAQRRPEPQLPLPGVTLGDPAFAERIDELLHGFGE